MQRQLSCIAKPGSSSRLIIQPHHPWASSTANHPAPSPCQMQHCISIEHRIASSTCCDDLEHRHAASMLPTADPRAPGSGHWFFHRPAACCSMRSCCRSSSDAAAICRRRACTSRNVLDGLAHCAMCLIWRATGMRTDATGAWIDVYVDVWYTDRCKCRCMVHR